MAGEVLEELSSDIAEAAVVEFISADLLADVLASPTKIASQFGLSKDQLMLQLASLLHEAQYEQDVIATNGAEKGLYLHSLAPKLAPKTLKDFLSGVAVFKERNTAKVDTPLVTVLMPSIFRDVALLDRALSSVLAQEYTNWKVVVVGDGIMPEFLQLSAPVEDAIQEGRIIITRTGHPGLYPSGGMERWHVAGREPLNFGISISPSPIIARLDDDDTWLPNHLSLVVEEYKKTDGNAVIYTQPCKWGGEEVFTDKESWRDLPFHNVMFTCNVAYCGNAVVADMYYDNDCSAPGDWRLYKKLLNKGHRFIKIPVVSSFHTAEAHQSGRLQNG